MNKYKGFNNNLTKDDLNEEELECYNKLMKFIKNTSQGEKDEVAHLMEVFIETDEKDYSNCVRCGKPFNNDNNSEHKRIYCDKCLIKMWG